jgi:DNA-binding CsgD family transcriptional regulator
MGMGRCWIVQTAFRSRPVALGGQERTMKNSPYSDETERQNIDGDTQRSGHEGDPSQNREHCGERSCGRHLRHPVNCQNGRDDRVPATQLLACEFCQSDSSCRTRAPDAMRGGSIALHEVSRIAELEQELEAMRTVLQGAIRGLEISKETQTAICDAASPPNEGHQLTRIALLEARNELQSLKQELAALKSQMLETLGPHPTASKDPQNARHSPAGAKLFISMSNSDPLASSGCHPGGSCNSSALIAWRKIAADHIAGLTPRQREVMELVLAGRPSKNIAAQLCISQRTVENHRASIMKKTGSKSLPALTRLALFATASGADGLALVDFPS